LSYETFEMSPIISILAQQTLAMKSFFEKETYTELLSRIEKIVPDTKRLWGKMDVAQMMAHTSEALEMATGNKKFKRHLTGRIFSPLVKKGFLSDKPFPKNSPTDSNIYIKGQRDFTKEKARLLSLVKQFHEGGEAKATSHPHSFFGHFTPAQWGTTQYKHIDHHLQQFGV
jgi:hypothetical protein